MSQSNSMDLNRSWVFFIYIIKKLKDNVIFKSQKLSKENL